jgi:hypothetical protein
MFNMLPVTIPIVLSLELALPVEMSKAEAGLAQVNASGGDCVEPASLRSISRLLWLEVAVFRALEIGFVKYQATRVDQCCGIG